MRWARVLPDFRRLHWKLTLTYTLVTTAAILVVEVVLLLVAWFLFARSQMFLTLMEPLFEKAAVVLAPALEQSPPNVDALDAWVEKFGREGVVVYQENGEGKQERLKLNLDPATVSLAAVIDARGEVLAVYPKTACARGNPLAACLADDLALPVQRALAGNRQPTALVGQHNGRTIVVAPIYSRDNRLLGALAVVITVPQTVAQLPAVILPSLLSSALVVLVITAIVGTVFGFFTARGLTRRLNRLMHAADAWSRGDFSLTVHDTSQDELGHLARRLNRMAEELQNLLQTRQELAALEERNRLARELHDSVKQQVFATAMQVAAARSVLDHDPAQAKMHLEEAEHLARKAQQELTALIRELRPAALEGKGLAVALREYVADWSHQTGIEAEVRVQGERTLPLRVEQALFRIAQEALSNVAKHSEATRVDIHLQWMDDEVTLTIADNGRGFDVDAAWGKGVGLRSIQERVEGLNGHLAIDSEPGRGTRIKVWVKEGVKVEG